MRSVSIPEDVCSYLEFLTYETNALQDLLVRMSLFENDVKTELKNYWTDKYLDTYTEYMMAKNQLEKEYIRPTLKENESVNWNLNFDSCEVVIQ